MDIYIIRHSTTVWNEKGITQGQTNNRLSKSGIEKTLLVAKSLENVEFDVIFTSPLMRAVQTANLLNTNKKFRIVKDSRLIDINQGEFTGKVYKTLTSEQLKIKIERKGKNMESYKSVFMRTLDFYNEQIKGSGYKNVLIVTHSINASSLELILNNDLLGYLDESKLRNFANAEIKKITI